MLREVELAGVADGAAFISGNGGGLASVDLPIGPRKTMSLTRQRSQTDARKAIQAIPTITTTSTTSAKSPPARRVKYIAGGRLAADIVAQVMTSSLNRRQA